MVLPFPAEQIQADVLVARKQLKQRPAYTGSSSPRSTTARNKRRVGFTGQAEGSLVPEA